MNVWRQITGGGFPRSRGYGWHQIGGLAINNATLRFGDPAVSDANNAAALEVMGALPVSGVAGLRGSGVNAENGVLGPLAGAGTVTFGTNLSLNAAQNTFTGAIIVDGGNARRLYINGASAHVGGTTVKSGELWANAAGALGAGPTVVAGGMLALNAAGAATGPVTATLGEIQYLANNAGGPGASFVVGAGRADGADLARVGHHVRRHGSVHDPRGQPGGTPPRPVRNF